MSAAPEFSLQPTMLGQLTKAMRCVQYLDARRVSVQEVSVTSTHVTVTIEKPSADLPPAAMAGWHLKHGRRETSMVTTVMDCVVRWVVPSPRSTPSGGH